MRNPEKENIGDCPACLKRKWIKINANVVEIEMAYACTVNNKSTKSQSLEEANNRLVDFFEITC